MVNSGLDGEERMKRSVSGDVGGVGRLDVFCENVDLTYHCVQRVMVI